MHSSCRNGLGNCGMACEKYSVVQAQATVVFGVEFCIGEGQNAVRFFSRRFCRHFCPYMKDKMLSVFSP